MSGEILQAQISALIFGWERDVAEAARSAARGQQEGTEGNDLRRYWEGYADALGRCVQALKLLYPGPVLRDMQGGKW